MALTQAIPRDRTVDSSRGDDSRAAAVLRFDNAAVAFDGRFALDGISTEVHPGETRVLFGATNSGKTVLLKTAIGLLRTETGRVNLFGHEITNLSEQDLFPLRRRVGVLFQEGGLFDSLTVQENLEFPLVDSAIVKPPASDVQTRVEEALAFVGLAGTGEKYPSELSGGMRRRVGIARAIVNRPTLVLYDSPTAGLDPITAYRIVSLLIRQRDTWNTTTVIVTHRYLDAYLLANYHYDRRSDRVIRSSSVRREVTCSVLREGRIVFEGTLPELSASTDPYIAMFARKKLARPESPSSQQGDTDHGDTDKVLHVLYPSRAP